MLSSEILDWKGLKSWQKIWSGSRSKAMLYLSLLILVLPMHGILRNYQRRTLKHLCATFTTYTLLIRLVVE